MVVLFVRVVQMLVASLPYAESVGPDVLYNFGVESAAVDVVGSGFNVCCPRVRDAAVHDLFPTQLLLLEE